MSKRKRKDDTWEFHREELYRLYEVNSESLPPVMKHMESQYGFVKTKPQYERAFKSWGFKKRNISKNEWRYIDSRLLEREANGQHHSIVRFRGEAVPEAKIKKQRKNYTMTTFEQQRFLLKLSPGPATPLGLEIYTPPRLSPALDAGGCIPYRAMESGFGVVIPDNIRFLCAKRTPWHHFMHLLYTLNIPGSHNKVIETSIRAGSGQESLLVNSSSFEKKVEDLICKSSINFPGPNKTAIRPAVSDPTPYLPAHKNGSIDININECRDLSPLGKHLELLKHVVFLLSNNFDTWKIAPIVVELARESQNRQFLSQLMSYGSVTAEAVAEKLLIPAAKGKNFPLMISLLDLGVDVNYSDSEERSLLQYAIESCNENLVCILLERGARFWEKKDSDDDPPEDTLTLAVRMGNFNIVKQLLQQLEKSPEAMKTAFIHDPYTTAVYKGDVEILDLLISTNPQRFEVFRHKPWVLFETAAVFGDIGMLDALRAKGLDIHAKNHLNRGSPLVYALANNQVKTAEYLLQTGLDINAYGSGLVQVFDDYEDVGDVSSLAPIHCAIFTKEINISRHLIQKGANPNQPGIMFPIQLAAMVGNMEIVLLLLNAGANLNDVSLPSHFDYYSSWNIVNRDGANADKFFISKMHAIQIALEAGDRELFNLLLECGALLPTVPACYCSPPRKDDGGSHDLVCERVWNPLLNAAVGKNISLFCRILDVAIVEKKPWTTDRCLTTCIECLGWEFIDQMVEKEAFPPFPTYPRHVLFRCIEEGAEDRFKDILLYQELDPRDTDIALILAVSRKSESMVRLLLETGCWPDTCVECHLKDREMLPFVYPWYGQCSAFREALEMNDYPMIDLILRHYKINTNKAQEATFKKHIMQAYGIAIRWGNLYTIQVFPSGAGINNVLHQMTHEDFSYLYSDSSHGKVLYRSAVQSAANCKKYDMVNLLLNHEADPNIRDEGHGGFYLTHSCLQCASRDGDILLAKKLLDKGADVNAPPAKYHGATALQFAAIEGRFDIADLLIKTGADINAPAGYYEGRTAIEGAGEHGKVELVSYLLELGADVLGKNNINYKRTVYRAQNQGHHALARMIHKWKAEHDGLTDDSDEIEKIMATMKDFNLKHAEGYGSERTESSDEECGSESSDEDF
ncbi:ankyrin [Amniculicola lignicola CBS 123094]|uniref:Ankyrin n=1 Tax=Amniculicola lignicola CBS 123094 TaxID=1392246 RepID=A0A6A5WSS5_9PLEO|nr:ankyrin [Amniculicola lignicola CBS 123094]